VLLECKLKMNKTRTLTFAALMAALSSLLSIPPFSIPIAFGPFTSEIHFNQIPIFISGILAGPWAGLLTGATGGLYMSITRIPFIIIGLAILGLATGFFAKRLKLKPFFAIILAWCVQAPYVLMSDYLWFVFFTPIPYSVVLTTIITILVKLSIEALISATFVAILIPYIQRLGLFTKGQTTES